MPNHVQNLVLFDSEINCKNLKVETTDFHTVAKATEIMLKLGIKEARDLLNLTDYGKAAELAYKIWTDHKLHLPENEKAILDVDGDAHVEKLRKPFHENRIKLDWYESYLFYPCPLGVLVNGFNGSFNKEAKENGFETIPFPSEYDWNIDVIGTKWGVYDVFYGGDNIAFNTAWSPLSREAALKFVKHADNILGAKVWEMHYAEAGTGYCGSIIFEKSGDEYRIVREECAEIDVRYPYDEEEEKRIKQEGYELWDAANELYTPSGKPPHEAVEFLINYGYGLGG